MQSVSNSRFLVLFCFCSDLSLTPCDYIYYHGCAYYRCYGIERDYAFFAWHDAYKIACQSRQRSCDDSSRDKLFVIVCIQNQAGNVWDGKPHEGYRTAKRSRRGCEKSGDEQQLVAQSDGVDAKVCGVLAS